MKAVVEAEGLEILRKKLCHSTQTRDRGPTGYEWVVSTKVLGAGAFGTVEVVKSRQTGEVFAMKRVLQHSASMVHSPRSPKPETS